MGLRGEVWWCWWIGPWWFKVVCVDEELKMDLLTEPCAVCGEGGRRI